MGLRGKFILSFIIFFTILTGSITFYMIDKERKSITYELKQKGIAITKSVARVSKEFLLEESRLNLVKLAYEIERENPGILYCAILDRDGKIAGHSDQAWLGKPFPYSIKEPVGDGEISIKPITQRGVKTLDVGIPVMYSGVKIGEVHLGLSQATIDQAVKESQKTLLLIVPLLFILGIIGMIFLVNYIAKPLKTLSHHLYQIGEGNLGVRLETKRNDELGVIARTTNEMVEKLNRAYQEIKQNERLKREMELAQEIQKTLLPSKIPKIEGYDIVTYYIPARFVSGDYYDVISGIMGFVIMVGDVSGKGVGSSMIMSMVKSYIYATIKRTTSPKQMLIGTHYFLRKTLPDDMFVTLFLLNLERGGKFTYAGAGHNPPVLFKLKEKRVSFLECKGTPLGIPFIPLDTYVSSIDERSDVLEPGDVLLLYTDGLTEVMDHNKEIFGINRVADCILKNYKKPSKEIRNSLLSEINSFRNGVPLHDDITLVGIKKL